MIKSLWRKNSCGFVCLCSFLCVLFAVLCVHLCSYACLCVLFEYLLQYVSLFLCLSLSVARVECLLRCVSVLMLVFVYCLS